MTITVAVPGSQSPATIETRASWLVCLTALGIAAVSFAAPAITVVGLKSIAAELGGERSVPRHRLGPARQRLVGLRGNLGADFRPGGGPDRVARYDAVLRRAPGRADPPRRRPDARARPRARGRSRRHERAAPGRAGARA